MEGVARVDSYLFGFLKPVKRRAADPLHPLPQSGTPFEGGLRVRATLFSFWQSRIVASCL